jgi:PAS domain S-box-containing protein
MSNSQLFISQDELDRVVGERTAELQRLNDELRAEIAERKQAEDALRRKESYLAEAQRLSQTGSWVYDAVRGVSTYWSAEQYRICGFAPEDGPPSAEKDRAHHPPEEWTRLMETVGRAVREKADFETDSWLEFPDGSTKYLRIRGRPVVNASGDIVELVGTTTDITEHRLAEDTNRRLAWIVESTDDAVLSRTPEGIITSWNKGAEKIFGFRAVEIIGRHISTIIPDDRTDEVKNIMDSARRGEALRLETVRLRKDGRRIDVALTISAIRDAQDRLVGASVIARDITERKRLEERQVRAARHGVLRAEVAAAFNESKASLRAVLQICVEAVVRHLDAAFARIWTLNDEQNMLELQASAGLYTHLDGGHARIRVGSHKIGLVAAERKPDLTNSIQDDERVGDKEWARREGMISFAGYPLTVEGHLVGGLAMFARHVLDEDIIEVLESIAPIIAQGIERKLAEGRLLLIKYTIDHVAESAAWIASDARFIFANEAVCNALGYTREELLGLTVNDIDPNFPPEVWAAHLSSLRVQKSLTLESTHRRKDGRTYPVELSLNYLQYNGQDYFFAFGRDITERKQREEAMQLLTTRLLHLQDEERRKIARDLHDVTAQDLGAVVVNLAHLRRLVTDLRPEAQTIVAESVSLSEQVLQQIRTLSYLLHPPLLDQSGLASALRWYVQGFTKRSGIQVDVEIDGEVGRLPQEIETALFRITQECLTNIHRHSGSSLATIRLIKTGLNLSLHVKDRGTGMIDEAAGETLDSIQSLGLGVLGMRQRVRQFGGTLELKTSKHGTEIIASVPVPGG